MTVLAALDSLRDQTDEDVTFQFGPLACDANGTEPNGKNINTKNSSSIFRTDDTSCFQLIAKLRDSVRMHSTASCMLTHSH